MPGLVPTLSRPLCLMASRLSTLKNSGTLNTVSELTTTALTDLTQLLIEHGMCGCRKYPYLPHGRLLEILRGRGVSKAKVFLKESTKLKWNLQRGGVGPN